MPNVIADNKKYTLIKHVAAHIITDPQYWMELLQSDMMCITKDTIYFYKLEGYVQENKNKDIDAVSNRECN